MKCSTDPLAPHGFDRNESISQDRYVCECEIYEAIKSMRNISEIKRALSQPDLLVSNKQWREWCEWLVKQMEGK
jgi:hypothetical protein